MCSPRIKCFRAWLSPNPITACRYLSLFLLEAGFLLTGIIIVAVEVDLDLDFAQEIYMLDTNVSARLENDNADPNITSHFPDSCDASEPMYCTSRGANYYFNSEFFFHLAIAVLFLLDYLYLKLQAPRQWLGNHFSICTAEIQWRCLICATWFLVILLQSLNFFIGDNSIFQSNFALPAGKALCSFFVVSCVPRKLSSGQQRVIFCLSSYIQACNWCFIMCPPSSTADCSSSTRWRWLPQTRSCCSYCGYLMPSASRTNTLSSCFR